MALIRCPECNKEVSDTAATCPNCGYSIAGRPEFEKKTTQLSAPYKDKAEMKKGWLELIGGIVLVVGGLPFVGIVVGIVIDILGVISIISGIGTLQKRKQQGNCPYCGELLYIKAEAIGGVKCPKCQNMFKKSSTKLETTH